MTSRRLAIHEVILFESKVFGDDSGFFFVSFNQRQFEEAVGKCVSFVQDNHACSVKNVLRGLRYQIQQPQGKLVRVVQGKVFDMTVDIRKDSPTFGNWVDEVLFVENKKQLWIPAGFAHVFLILSDNAEFLYKTTDYWASAFERCIQWDDLQLGINWPATSPPIASAKDALGNSFITADKFE